MSQAQRQAPSAAQLAENALRTVLQTQWEGVAAVRLDSPPGAGKTRVVELLAVQSLQLMQERCMVVTQTNEQAFDLARRLAQGFPRLHFGLFVKRGLVLPGDLSHFANLSILDDSRTFPTSPCVIISNATKWAWIRDGAIPFDCQIVDEAFQLPDYRFQQIAGLGRRIVLIGDPGQIPPVIACPIERWRCDPAGPHVPAPRALLERHSAVRTLSLPVSRRLPPDTVQVVQPAFYPELPFQAIAAPGERGLGTQVAGVQDVDPAIDLAAQGASLVQVELPARITGEVDPQLADTIVRLVERLFERRTWIRDHGQERELEPGMVGVVCAHVLQVNAVRERLGDLSDVFVETSDRFQGLERAVMVVHHPLSGRADATTFHMECGRLCVMLSRHRVACFVVSRGGIEELLLRYAPSGDRVLGLEQDAEFEGWRAHLSVLQELRRLDRVRSIRP